MMSTICAARTRPAIERHFVEHPPRGRQHDRVLDRTALYKPGLAKRFHLAKETEGARRSELAREGAVRDVDRALLPTDYRVVEVDAARNTELVRRLDADRPVRLSNLDWAHDPKVVAPGFEANRSRLLEEVDHARRSRRGWALHTVDLDDAVVDPSPTRAASRCSTVATITPCRMRVVA